MYHLSNPHSCVDMCIDLANISIISPSLLGGKPSHCLLPIGGKLSF